MLNYLRFIFKGFKMRFIVIFLSLLLASCASTVDEIIVDNHVLKSNTGLALIPIFSNLDIYQIRISGEKYFQFDANNIDFDKKYLLVELPAGEYSYSEIRLNKYTIISEFEEGKWSFNVKPGVINYAGHFVIHNSSEMWGVYQLSFMIHNNASMALEYLEDHYPHLLKTYSIVYSGPGEDDFFSFIESLSSLRGSE